MLFPDQVLEKAEASWEAADKSKTEAGWCLDTAVGPGFPIDKLSQFIFQGLT